MDFKKGEILLVDKPINWTSFDVVKKIRYIIKRRYQIEGKFKVGHAGTLDPLATGLMIICTGKATKKITELMGMNKEYIAEIELGATTPSFDLETEIDCSYPYNHITKDLVNQVLSEKFTGKLKQIPPKFSAKRINGKRAYEYARKGEDVKIEPVDIEIYKHKLISFDLPKITIDIECSKGTYIRSIANDLGKSLNTGAHLTGLVRKKIGDFSLNNAISIEKFEKSLLN